MSFIVIKPSIVGNASVWDMAYSTDRVEHETREQAIEHGWRETGHDDWLIGELEDGRLIELAWMDEIRDDAKELADCAEKLSL